MAQFSGNSISHRNGESALEGWQVKRGLSLFPPLSWLPYCNTSTVTKDFLAALIIVVMLVPQALGYAVVAGMPPYVGLYVSILPPILYALSGTSMALQVGVCAIIAIMTNAGANMIGGTATPEHIAAGMMLALLSGGMLVAMGILRLGFIANFLSRAVISGFVTAASLTVAATQIKHLLGIAGKGDTLFEMAGSMLPHLPEIKLPTVIFALCSLAGFLLMRRYFKRFLQMLGLSPQKAGVYAGLGPFLVITTAIFLSWALQADEGFLRQWAGLGKLGIRTVGDIPSGLPSLSWPSFDLHPAADKVKDFPTPQSMWQALIGYAALMSLIIFVETVSVGQALAQRRRQKVDPNQEMIAIGLTNLASAFSGGYPAAGGFSRSAVSYNAGSQTPLAAIFTALGIALVTMYLTKPLYYLPYATLAALIVIAAMTLVDIKAFIEAWKYSKRDFAAMLVTCLVTLMFGVEKGLLAGLVLSTVLYIYHISRPHFAVLGLVPGTQQFRDISCHETVTSENIISLRIDESLCFANARYVEELVQTLLVQYPNAKHLVLECLSINDIDMSALETLNDINMRLQRAGMMFHLSMVKEPIKERLQRSDFLEHLSGKIFPSHYQAVQSLAPEIIQTANSRG